MRTVLDSRFLFFVFLFSLIGPRINLASDLETASEFDIQRYSGLWFQIVHIPNKFQASCVSDSTAFYRLNANGELQVTNECRLDSGKLKSVKGIARMAKVYNEPSKLEVSFAPKWMTGLPFLWGDYWIFDVDDEYQTALVGSPNYKYLWVLSRTKDMEKTKLLALTALAEQLGFNIALLEE